MLPLEAQHDATNKWACLKNRVPHQKKIIMDYHNFHNNHHLGTYHGDDHGIIMDDHGKKGNLYNFIMELQ